MQDFEIVVAGGGLAGSVAALALARAGRKLALVSPPLAITDERTTALMDPSIAFLDRLGLWREVAPASAPLAVMQIIDATGRLLHAPTARFRASDIGLAAFGYNIPNSALFARLHAALEAEPNLTRIAASVEKAEFPGENVTLSLSDDTVLRASFAIAADGRRSLLREAVGIGVRTWSYPQSALVLNFAHSLPHQQVSTEFHTRSGPFTQVPLPGQRSSLVWTVRPEEAEHLASLGLEELSGIIEDRMQSMLGKVSVEATPQLWPLSSLVAHRFGKGRLALLGEAAHAFPPIGAQGLNLSLRDAMTLSELLSAATGRPVAADAGERFDRRRRGDVTSRIVGVDLLNRSLLSDLLPAQMLRAGGLHFLGSVPFLRNFLMREGLEPGRGLRALLPGRPA